MMKPRNSSLPLWLLFAVVTLVTQPAVCAYGQAEPGGSLPEGTAPAKPSAGGTGQSAPNPAPAAANVSSAPKDASNGAVQSAATAQDRAQAYFHLALANSYEEDAVTLGRPELVTQAIEEYKSALNADPGSSQLNDGLADLYFRTGHTHDAEVTARGLLKNTPNDIDAHKLLGKIYLRQLSDGSNAVSSTSPSGNALDQAIAEFEKIVALQPKSVEDRMVLGQLYTVKHDPKKAEEEFATAQSIEPESEEVVLNLARVYAESGDLDHAAKVIEAVPVEARSPKMEVALGAAYDQLKRPKDAIAAYQRAVDLDPGDEHTLDTLGQALLNDNQLDEALKQFKALYAADPEEAEALVHIGEIERRQGKYEDALATIRKARKLDATSLEAGYNEGLLLDVLARYDEAADVYEKMVDMTSHANGAYTGEEKNNRGIFLDRLGAIYHEQNKTDKAVAAYQKMIELGGDSVLRGYQGEVDAYRDAKQFDKAIEVSRKAVEASAKALEANPKDKELKAKDVEFKLMLAGELADQGKADEGLAMAKAQLDNSDNDRTVWLALGQMDIRLRRWKDAEDAFNRAGALTSKKEDRTYLLFLRGELAERQKHYEPAEQFFRQALEMDPNSSMTMNYLGYMMADKGTRLTEALGLIRKAVELEPMNGAYLDSLGWAYFKLGQYELAEENLRQAVERDQTDPTVHDHLGDLYEKTGRIRLAAAQWELSLAEYSKSLAADVDPGDAAKVQHKLENARVKLAKQESTVGPVKP
jgi:tetratricopeptide (TPR) repeat protein